MKEELDIRFAAIGLAMYGLLLAACIGASALWPTAAGVPWTGAGPAAVDVGLGLATGAAIVAFSWGLMRWLPSGRRLTRLLAKTVQGLPGWTLTPLAIAAGLAEEAAFRGCLWSATEVAAGPLAAWLATSIAFGLSHGMFRKGLRTWGAFALATGLILGGLRLRTGGILAPVLAHVLVDAVNLPLVQRVASRPGAPK